MVRVLPTLQLLMTLQSSRSMKGKSTDDQRKKMFEDQVRKDSKEECGSDSARAKMIKRMKGGDK